MEQEGPSEGSSQKMFVSTRPAISVELGIALYLTPPVTSRSPKNQNGTKAKDALFMENAECVGSISRLCELCGFDACIGSPVRALGRCVHADRPAGKLNGLEKKRDMRTSKTKCMRPETSSALAA